MMERRMDFSVFSGSLRKDAMDGTTTSYVQMKRESWTPLNEDLQSTVGGVNGQDGQLVTKSVVQEGLADFVCATIQNLNMVAALVMGAGMKTHSATHRTVVCFSIVFFLFSLHKYSAKYVDDPNNMSSCVLSVPSYWQFVFMLLCSTL